MKSVINYYNKLSRGYDELYGEEQLKKFEFIKDKIVGEKILDAGCGNGKITSLLPGWVVGVDISREMIKYYNGLKVVAAATHLPFKTKSFDLVFSLTMLQDVDNKKGAIGEFKRVGKRILFSVLKKSFNMELKEFKKTEGKKDLFYQS